MINYLSNLIAKLNFRRGKCYGKFYEFDHLYSVKRYFGESEYYGYQFKEIKGEENG